MKSGLPQVPAALLIALIAVTLSALASFYSYRSVREMREAQQVLTQRIEMLRAVARVETDPNAPAADEPNSQSPLDGKFRAGNRRGRDAGDFREPPWDEEEIAPRGEISAAMRESRDGLLQIYDQLDAPSQRKALGDLAIFARWGDPEALGAIVGAIRDPDPKTRKKAVSVIGKLRDPELVLTLERLLDDPEPKVRKEVAKTVDKLSGPYAEPMLIALLADPDPDIVTNAIKRLGSGRYQGSRRAVARLVESDDLCQTEPNPST